MTTDMQNMMRQLLEEAFAPSRLEIVDDSHQHAGHAGSRPGGQTHYTVRIDAAGLKGLGRVQAQREVYRILQPCFDAGLHALALRIV